MVLSQSKRRKGKRRCLILLPAAAGAAVLAFLLWTSFYYHAGDAALAAMQSDGIVSVEKTKTGWLFDGPSDENALIFYPGAKVDERSYAPVLHALAARKADVYLIRMPFHLAFFGINTAHAICKDGRYVSYFIGGHSLGGAMAAGFAAGHEEKIAGEILLAAYPTKKTDVDTLLIYGSEDGVLNMGNVAKAKELVTGAYDEYCIEGGNHACFGDYGKQSGDGIAAISAEEQQRQTREEMEMFIDRVNLKTRGE